MTTFLHYVRCKDALLDCSAPGGERYESLTRVDEIKASLLTPQGSGAGTRSTRHFERPGRLGVQTIEKKKWDASWGWATGSGQRS